MQSSQVAGSKLLLRRMLEGGAIECLVSFAAVSAGDLRALLAETGSKTAGMFEAMAEGVRWGGQGGRK